VWIYLFHIVSTIYSDDWSNQP